MRSSWFDSDVCSIVAASDRAVLVREFFKTAGVSIIAQLKKTPLFLQVFPYEGKTIIDNLGMGANETNIFRLQCLMPSAYCSVSTKGSRFILQSRDIAKEQ